MHVARYARGLHLKGGGAGALLQMAQAQRLQQDAQEEHGAQHGEAIVDHYFRHLWAAKESVLKLRGDGLSFPPCNASFHIPHMLPLTQSGASVACMHAAQLAILGT